MAKVFGLPATELAVGMTAILAVIFLIIVIGATRRFILVKMFLGLSRFIIMQLQR